MGRRRGRYSALASDEEMNLTPLLDVIFNLIFFFILATNIRTEESFFEVKLAESKQATPEEAPKKVPNIFIFADGSLALDTQKMTSQEIQAELTRRVQQDGVTAASIRADKGATMQQLADAMGIVVSAGITDTALPVSTDAVP